jgi:hypothetical protein
MPLESSKDAKELSNSSVYYCSEVEEGGELENHKVNYTYVSEATMSLLMHMVSKVALSCNVKDVGS